MSDFVPKERAQTYRDPATANLMIDSADRTLSVNPLANDFSIQRANSVLNGFFTRVGTTELVLEWFTPNFSPIGQPVDSLTVDYTAPDVAETTFTAPRTFFTQGDLIDWVLTRLNLLGATLVPPVTWAFVVPPAALAPSGLSVRIAPNIPCTLELRGSVARRLGLPVGPINYPSGSPLTFLSADLRLYRYLDFVSTQLTANQSLKDASTAPIVRDVLARWYFAFDEPPAYDQYGFPILQGYTPFVLRRTFSPPKQIRWEPNIPIGNLTFQVYAPDGKIALMTPEMDGRRPSEWLMTLQVSES